MGKAKILVSQCTIIALTVLVFVIDHNELTKQQMMTTTIATNDTHKIPNTNESEIAQQQQQQQQQRPPLAPNQVLQQYIQWHSQAALANHNHHHSQQRKYALIYYYCPNRAGNILHSMFNSVIWAILHNRTILWKYDTDFSDPNTAEECQQTLQRADWWPSWDEWAPKLNLTEPVPIQMDPLRRHEYQTITTVVFPMIPDQMSRHKQFVRVDWRDDPMHKRKHRQYIMAMDDPAIRTAGRLYQYGVDYLLGMLFRELFTIQLPMALQTTADDFTVALHSRHTVVGDDGSFITDETKCLETLLQNRTQSANCVVFLMSDRPTTVQLLKEWLVDRNCTGVSTDDYASVASSPLLFRDEHGPNPGVGFIRDLALVSQARSALVGDPGRSSYMLLQEIVEYDRRIDDWKWGRESPETIPFCPLPGRYGKGYDYGPGTPHFIAFWRNQPWKPVQVLQEYKIRHSVEALRNKSDMLSNRSFVIGYLPSCWMDDVVDDLRIFLHDFLRAVATNQTFVWKDTSESSDCPQPTMNMQSWLPSYEEWKDFFPLPKTRDDWTFNNNTIPAMDKNELTLLLRNESSLTFTMDYETLDMLYEQGSDYLYGLLFHESIKLGASTATDDESTQSREDHVTKVLWYDDGDRNPDQELSSFSHDTLQCLDPVLSNATKACQIIVLVRSHVDSDHVPVVSDQFPQCSILKRQETELRQLLQLSHDPTWSAFVGPRNISTASSTSLLLRERLVYQRREVIWKLGRFPPSVPDLVLCNY